MSSGVETALVINDEARMPNVEGIPNIQMTNRDKGNFSLFGFRHSFVIRHSDFVIALILRLRA
jgi:hypothetical protein